MSAIERIRQQLRAIQARDYAARIRRQLARWPDDPDLRWALAELERTEPLRPRSEIERRQGDTPRQA